MKIRAAKFLWNAPLALILFQLWTEGVRFYNAAWDTGEAVGRFAWLWLALFLLFTLFLLALAILFFLLVWKPAALTPLAETFIALREKIAQARWLLAFFILLFPAYFFQYTIGGVLFRQAFMRWLIWALTAFLFSALISKGRKLTGWGEFLIALLLVASEILMFAPFARVSSYPFSIGWSEGNRMWDYSMLFGRGLYQIAPGEQDPVLLEFGRQLLGALPFLLPRVTIQTQRAWQALLQIWPYLLLGLILFSPSRKKPAVWVLGTLAVFVFLTQGPIHPPLVVAAALTAWAWRKPLRAAAPLIVFASYFAWMSRFNWAFAPGLWIGMLEFLDADMEEKPAAQRAWARAIILGLSGLFGGFFLPQWLRFEWMQWAVVISPATVSESVSTQPLLWYRLLPNATYRYGVLLSLALAVLPLILLLSYLFRARVWRLNFWQRLALLAPLAAFLFVGLIASAKIGGGGDLHNLDMFLIALTFAAAVAWRNGGEAWLRRVQAFSLPLKFLLAFMLLYPASPYVRQLYPYHFAYQANRLLLLTDSKDVKSLGMIPSAEISAAALKTVRAAVNAAKTRGEVLFIDQRQLLTFGYIQDVLFVNQYEKKMLMNEAMRPNLPYFERFYRDLAAHRFSLIVSEPLRTPIKDRDYHFGEENQAWVKYVSGPILCYYEPDETLREVGVQLLVPRAQPIDCSDLLP